MTDVSRRPTLSGMDAEDWWRMVESLVLKHKTSIQQRLGSIEQTKTIEDVKLGQGEIKALEWVLGLPTRTVEQIRREREDHG